MSIIDSLMAPFENSIQKNNRKNVAHHIFGGSTTMIGVCITIIALFKTMDASSGTKADEVLAVANFMFILSALLSYLSLRKNDNERLENFADVIFFSGMLLMLIVGFIIVFTDL